MQSTEEREHITVSFSDYVKSLFLLSISEIKAINYLKAEIYDSYSI